MSTVSSASSGWPRPQSAMPARGRTTTVASLSGHAPIAGPGMPGPEGGVVGDAELRRGSTGTLVGIRPWPSPDRDRLDLHAAPLAGQALDLEERAHRLRIREEAVAHGGELREVRHVGQEGLDLDDVAEPHPRRLEDLSDKPEDELGLGGRVVGGDDVSVEVDRELAREVERARAVVLDQQAGAVGAARGGVPLREDEGLLQGIPWFQIVANAAFNWQGMWQIAGKPPRLP